MTHSVARVGLRSLRLVTFSGELGAVRTSKPGKLKLGAVPPPHFGSAPKDISLFVFRGILITLLVLSENRCIRFPTLTGFFCEPYFISDATNIRTASDFRFLELKVSMVFERYPYHQLVKIKCH